MGGCEAGCLGEIGGGIEVILLGVGCSGLGGKEEEEECCSAVEEGRDLGVGCSGFSHSLLDDERCGRRRRLEVLCRSRRLDRRAVDSNSTGGSSSCSSEG